MWKQKNLERRLCENKTVWLEHKASIENNAIGKQNHYEESGMKKNTMEQSFLETKPLGNNAAWKQSR